MTPLGQLTNLPGTLTRRKAAQRDDDAALQPRESPSASLLPAARRCLSGDADRCSQDSWRPSGLGSSATTIKGDFQTKVQK